LRAAKKKRKAVAATQSEHRREYKNAANQQVGKEKTGLIHGGEKKKSQWEKRNSN